MKINNCRISKEREGKKDEMHVRVKFKYRIKIMRDRTDFPRCVSQRATRLKNASTRRARR